MSPSPEFPPFPLDPSRLESTVKWFITDAGAAFDSDTATGMIPVAHRTDAGAAFDSDTATGMIPVAHRVAGVRPCRRS
jgi:hypothetical protein